MLAAGGTDPNSEYRLPLMQYQEIKADYADFCHQ